MSGFVTIERSANGAAHCEQIDWRHVDPATLMTPEQCDEAMLALDEIIGGISTQLRQAAADYEDTGRRADTSWWVSAQHAVKRFRITRNAIQTRKGQISKAERALRAKEWEKRFVDEARRVLDVETFKRICAAADMQQ